MQPQNSEKKQEDFSLQGTQAEHLMIHMEDRAGEKKPGGEDDLGQKYEKKDTYDVTKDQQGEWTEEFAGEDMDHSAAVYEDKDSAKSAMGNVFFKENEDNAKSSMSNVLFKENEEVIQETKQSALPEMKRENPVQMSETSSMMSAELKLEQFQEIMTRIIGKALESNNKSLSNAISSEVSDKVSDRIMKQMDYLMRENEEREEERFRKLDETIRQRQKANAEAAAALAEDSKKKKKLRFGRRDKIKHRILS